MGFILAGVILLVIVAVICVRSEWSEAAIGAAVALALALLALLILLGIFLNTGGYQPAQEIKTYELQNLADQTTSSGHGNMFYVSIGAGNTFTFYTEVDSEFSTDGSKAYVSKTISGESNVTIIEEKVCEKPRMTVYYRAPIATFWSFAADDGLTSYVFYVPEGTIVHEYALGQK